MFIIESKAVGIYNFDYFSIDMAGGKYRMGGKEYPLGTACCSIANLSRDTTEKLLRLGAALNESRCKLLLLGSYNRELFREIEKHILHILTYIQRIEPFTFFDIAYSANTAKPYLTRRSGYWTITMRGHRSMPGMPRASMPQILNWQTYMPRRKGK